MSLIDLNLQSTRVDDTALVYVAKINSLKTINLQNTNVTITGIRTLFKNCKNLTLVTLGNSSHIGPKEIEELRGNFPAIQFTNHLDQDRFGSLDLALAFENLADYLVRPGKYLQAEQLYKRALALREKQSGGPRGTWFLAGTIIRLANCYVQHGKFNDAKPLYGQALPISEKGTQPSVQGVIDSLKGLAQCYEHEGKTTEANQMLNRARAIESKPPQ
jgi:tetratricopeptide (TPR) repeat protein